MLEIYVQLLDVDARTNKEIHKTKIEVLHSIVSWTAFLAVRCLNFRKVSLKAWQRFILERFNKILQKLDVQYCTYLNICTIRTRTDVQYAAYVQ